MYRCPQKDYVSNSDEHELKALQQHAYSGDAVLKETQVKTRKNRIRTTNMAKQVICTSKRLQFGAHGQR